MQAPAIVSTAPSQAPPNHARLGRSVPGALQAAVPPDGFANTIAQVLVGPGGDAPTQLGVTGPNKHTGSIKSPALPAPLSAPACIVPAQTMQVAGSVADAGEDVGVVPVADVTETEKDEPSASATRIADAAPLIAQPQPAAPPACLPVTSAASQIPDRDGPDATSSENVAASAASISANPLSIAVATVDAASAKPELGQPGPSTPLPPVNGVAQTDPAGMAVRSAPGRSSATATVAEAAVATLEDEAAIPKPSLASPVPATLAPANAALHILPTSPALPRPSASAMQTPVEQVGPALASFAASAAQPGAPQHLTIRLDPMDLGRVEVRIERIPGGPARVDLVVERPDTLLLLLRDEPQLHRALDLAGIPTAERTLQFHLAPPNASAPGTTAPQQNANPDSSQHRPDQSAQQRASGVGRAASLEDLTPRPAVVSRRAGIDITA